LFGLADLFGGNDVRPGRNYSSVEAAKLLGTDRKTILRLVRSGALKAAKGDDKNYRISGQAIVDFLSCRDL